MAESLPETADDTSLVELFLSGWDIYDELDKTNMPTNSAEFKRKVRSALEIFGNCTKIVSQVGMFSDNEMLDDISTDTLQYALLPFFMGKLQLQLNAGDRVHEINCAETYFQDFLRRCANYELYDKPPEEGYVEPKDEEKIANADNITDDKFVLLMRAANTRGRKLAQYRRKKELEAQNKLLHVAFRNKTIDEEDKRNFLINYIRWCCIDAVEEFDSLKLELRMLSLSNAHKMQSQQINEEAAVNPHAHAHAHAHSHNQPPRPPPLQPFVIARNEAQKAVYGAGYPSLPIMTVNDFYEQRVREGIFPNEERVAQMNAAQAVAAAQDPNEKEDAEQAVVEEQIENDDPEYLARMRRMDEYKDVVRRGDGNRHNRS